MTEQEWAEAIVKANNAGLAGIKVVGIILPDDATQYGATLVCEEVTK